MIRIGSFRIPSIPQLRVRHLVGQQVTRTMTHLIRRMEDRGERNINIMAFAVLGYDIVAFLILNNLQYGLYTLAINDLHGGQILVITIFTRQHHHTGRIDGFTNLTFIARNVGFLHEQVTFRGGQQIPIPIADGGIQIVLIVLNEQLLVIAQLGSRTGTIG